MGRRAAAAAGGECWAQLGRLAWAWARAGAVGGGCSRVLGGAPSGRWGCRPERRLPRLEAGCAPGVTGSERGAPRSAAAVEQGRCGSN